MTINTFETVLLTALFLIPGFIILAVVNTISPRKDGSDFHESLRYLSYSIVSLAIWSWAYIMLFKTYITNFDFSTAPWDFWLWLILITCGGSLILGTLIGIERKETLIKRFFSKIFNMNIPHPVTFAWDYKFSYQNDPCWVIVTLDNENTIAGWYSSNSLSSSDSSDRDIYIEKVYCIGDNNQWSPTSRTDGMWISSKYIKHIEFFK